MKYKFAYLAVIVAGLVVSPAFAQIELGEINPPITVMASIETINYGDTVEISGKVDYRKLDTPVTLKVTGPQGNIITLRQLDVNSDNTFSTLLNTAGPVWDYDGRYVVKVHYGSISTTNKTFLDLVGGSGSNPIVIPDTDTRTMVECNDNEFTVNNDCVEYTITGASIVGASTSYAGQAGNLLRIEINAQDDGTLTIAPNIASCNDSNYTVLVDGQQWDDVNVNGNRVSIDFFAGNSVIEVIGTCVVPEFGGIAAVILVIALVAVIIASSKGRIGIMPKY